MKPRRPPRDPDDMPLDELGIGRSDLGLDSDFFDGDRISERKEAELHRKEDAAEAERERLAKEWAARDRRMQDALRHIASKLKD